MAEVIATEEPEEEETPIASPKRKTLFTSVAISPAKRGRKPASTTTTPHILEGHFPKQCPFCPKEGRKSYDDLTAYIQHVASEHKLAPYAAYLTAINNIVAIENSVKEW